MHLDDARLSERPVKRVYINNYSETRNLIGQHRQSCTEYLNSL